MAVGAGAVWVADRLAGAVVRIDPATNSVTTTIPVGRSPDRNRCRLRQRLGGEQPRRHRVPDRSRTRQGREDDRGRREPAGDRGRERPGLGVSPDGARVPRRPDRRCRARRRPRTRLDSLDPAVANTLASWTIMYATCAGLFNYPDRPGAGGVATQSRRWRRHCRRARLTERATRSRFRPGFRFSPPSNAPVTAQTFKFAIERALSPKITLGPARNFAARHRRRGAYEAGKAKHISGIRVARQHPHGPADACRRRTSSRGSRCRTSAPSRPARRSRLRGVNHGALGGTVLRRLVHTGAGRGAEAESQLPRRRGRTRSTRSTTASVSARRRT